MTMTTEEELISNAIAGDQVAIQTLMLMHYSEIESTIQHNLGAELSAKMEVQDLMQDALVSVYQEIQSFVPSESGSFKAWVKRIAANRVVDAARKAQRIKRGGQAVQLNIDRHANESLDTVWDWVFQDSNQPDRPVRQGEAREAIQICVAQLEDAQREAVHGFYFLHQDTEEIAARMGRTPGAVRELLRRARINLAKSLGSASKWLSSR